MSPSLAIGYFGHGPWAHRALERILADRDCRVVFVATRRVGDAVLERLATDAGIPYLMPDAINGEAWRERLAGAGCDLFVSMSFDQIFRRPLLDAPRLGTINCHAGALPFYRGRNILNWAIINGETGFGVTVHRVDEGIDTGDILRQDMVPFGPDATYADVLALAHEACAATLHAALVDLRAGQAVARPQRDIHPVGFYCGRRREGDEWIDWTQSERRVHDFVRALSAPGLYARTLLDGRTLAVARTRRIAGAPAYAGTPGEIVGRTSGGIVVKTGDATIEVLATAALNGSNAPEFAVPRLATGTRFARSVSPELLALEARIAALESRRGEDR
ncbi:MAG: methionyl-tRNA formyltransferase [Proteobacteria bacterium]|nr:methionyl-tRNA formyltransferase [Pseudomonadota bacterium]